jgi:hypothetical protein
MTQPSRPEADLWYAIAALLSALRSLLRGTAPAAFAAISAEARARLAAITAMVRRYLHILAAAITLAPLRPRAPPSKTGSRRTFRIDPLFPLTEQGREFRSNSRSQGADPPELQWAILMQAAQRLVSVMANPAPHARRLALSLRRTGTDGLRDLPVRWHVLRRLGPAVDTLLMRLDQRARPEAWAGIAAPEDTS